MHILALGTSLTARGQWPAHLGSRLREGLGENVSVSVVARAGATTAWGLLQIGRVVGEKPDILLIELYANDARLVSGISPSSSARNMRTLLSTFQNSLPSTHILCMRMNPIWGPRRWFRPLLRSYENAHRQSAEECGVDYLDLMPAWRLLGSKAMKRAIPDGAHPQSDEASKIIVPRLSAHLEKVLQTR